MNGCASIWHQKCNKTAKLGQGTEIRVIGIDPDPPEAWANEASVYTMKVINGYSFTLEVPGPDFPNYDKSGRLLRYIRTPEDKDLGAELIRAGYVAVDTSIPHPRLDEYIQLEREARERKMGMWASF